MNNAAVLWKWQLHKTWTCANGISSSACTYLIDKVHYRSLVTELMNELWHCKLCAENAEHVLSGYSSRHKMRTKTKTDRCFLPHFMLYVAWSLCFTVIVGCTGVSVYFGIWCVSFLFIALSFLWLKVYCPACVTEATCLHVDALITAGQLFLSLLKIFQVRVILACLVQRCATYSMIVWWDRGRVQLASDFGRRLQAAISCHLMQTSKESA